MGLEVRSFRPQDLEDHSNNYRCFLSAPGNHWRALSREKDPTSVWDMLSLEGCMRHTGGRVLQALDMNPQRLRSQDIFVRIGTIYRWRWKSWMWPGLPWNVVESDEKGRT